MKVLIGCESSATVRDAFRLRGHDAWSCDLRPCEGDPAFHFQRSIFDVLYDDWDLLIGHPPCTFLSYAGTAHWNKPGRIKERIEALEFFRKLWEAPIYRIGLENPKGCASPVIAKYSQVIQPYFFGECQMKTTWLWLKNLPDLEHSKDDHLFGLKTHTDKPQPISVDGTDRAKKRYFTDAKTRCPFERSKTFQGIADAMAEQWGNL